MASIAPLAMRSVGGGMSWAAVVAGKAGEADIIIGIGKTGSSEVENTVRHICISKNKLNGYHGMINSQIDVRRGVYY